MEKTYKRFIKSLNTLKTDIPHDPINSLNVLKTGGLETFVQSAGKESAELVEIAELLTRMENRGVHHGTG